MPSHNSVHTTCTASMLTGWDLEVYGSNLERAQQKLKIVQGMQQGGYKRDFALIFAITTEEQLNEEDYVSKEILERIGFEASFVAEKDDEHGRHEETGALTMWCIKPEDYEKGLKALNEALKKEIADYDTPELRMQRRAKFPDFTLTELVKAGIATRGSVKDTFADRLQVAKHVFETHFRIKFGFNPEEGVPGYYDKPVLELKRYHQSWKEGK